ncbi:hypothetical protein Tco_0798482 [Tanacetum coccineum]
MFRGTPVISAGFQAKISKFCLSKEHSPLRPFSVNVDPMATVCSGYSGWIAIFIFSSSTWFTAGFWMLGSEIIAHSIGMTLLLCSVTVPPSTGNFNIPCAVDGTARSFLIPGLPIIALCWDGDLITMKFIHAEVECTSSPIFTSKAIWPSGQMVSLLNPIRQVVHTWRHPSIGRSSYPKALLVSSKLSDLLRTEADHLFLVDSRVVSISVSYESGMLLSSVGFKSILSCDMGLLDYIRTADPRKVQAVEVQKGEEQVTLFDSIKHCFVSLDAPAVAHQASGSGSGAGAEVARLKSLVKEKETKSAEVLRLRDQVSVLAADNSLLSAEVSVLKSAVSQKDTNISLLDSRASYLKSALDDSQAACGEARSLISSLSSERDGLASEKMEAQQEEQAQELYNRVAELEAHVMDVSGRLEGEFYPAYLTALAGRSFGEGRGDGLVRGDKILKSTFLIRVTSLSKSTLDDSELLVVSQQLDFFLVILKRDGLCLEVSTLHSAFRDFKEKMEAQQEAQAQELYNPVAELEAQVLIDGVGDLGGGILTCLLTALVDKDVRALDYGMQEGLAAGHEHGIAGTPLSAVVAYNPETAENNYLDSVRALKEADFPLVHLLKSKKDFGMDEVLDCFLLDGPLASLPGAAHLQPCLEQLSVPIYHADVNAVAGETSLSFALLNVYTRAEGAKKHAAVLR